MAAKTKCISVRVSRRELEMLKRTATAAGMTFAKGRPNLQRWLRNLALNAAIYHTEQAPKQ